MDLSNDIEDYVDKFRNIFYNQRDNKVSSNDMWCLVENLSRELEISKEHGNNLQNNWRLHLESEDANLTTKYIALNEKCARYKEENNDLKIQVNELQTEMRMELAAQVTEYLGKMAELNDNYKREVANLKNQMESDRICYETKERELYNELQLAQASTAIQCDEIESNFTRQLVDATYKLRQSQNFVRDLQITINSLKTQVASQQSTTPSHQKPSKKELKFQPLPLTKNNSAVVERRGFDDKQSSEEDLEFVETVPAYNPITTPPVYKGKIRTAVAKAQVNKAKKKRKLYNPNDIDNTALPTYD